MTIDRTAYASHPKIQRAKFSSGTSNLAGYEVTAGLTENRSIHFDTLARLCGVELNAGDDCRIDRAVSGLYRFAVKPQGKKRWKKSAWIEWPA